MHCTLLPDASITLKNNAYSNLNHIQCVVNDGFLVFFVHSIFLVSIKEALNAKSYNFKTHIKGKKILFMCLTRKIFKY